MADFLVSFFRPIVIDKTISPRDKPVCTVISGRHSINYQLSFINYHLIDYNLFVPCFDCGVDSAERSHIKPPT